MAKYSYAQLEGLWIQAGGSPSRAPLMAAIAMAESGGNSNAENPSGASGLWQILGAPDGWTGSQNWKDPAINAKAAVAKYETQGLGAWATYTSGAYRLYYHPNIKPDTIGLTAASGGSGSEPLWLQILQGVTTPGQIPPGAVAGDTGVLGGITAAGHVLGDLGSGAWWSRVGKGAIGGGLILGGVYLMMRKEGYKPVKTMVTAGKKAAEVTAVA